MAKSSMNDEDSLPWIDEFVACVERATLSHQNIEEAISIKQGYLPKRIYKYRRDCSYAVQNLEENTVWMANPDTYNDPYDCSFKVVKEKAMAEFLKTEHGKFIARTAKHAQLRQPTTARCAGFFSRHMRVGLAG